MPQNEDNLLDDFLQKLEDDESIEDLSKYILETVFNKLLEREMDKHISAKKYERSEKRSGYRNGYRERKLYTRVGTLNLRVPRDRDGNFSTEIFNKFQRSEKALILTLQEMYLDGVSTRKAKKITEKLCGTEFSKDQVSRLVGELDEGLEDWRERSLDEDPDDDDDSEGSGVSFPYLIIDATYEKVRENGRIRDRAALMVAGIDTDGHRQFLGTYTKASESESSWSEVFTHLIKRGLDPTSVKYIVSDKHVGMRKAIAKFFPHALWQRCQTHYQRNAESKITGKEETKALHDHLRDLFNSPNRETALARADKLIEFYRDSYPDLADWLEETIHETLTVFELPQKHRRRLRTNNCIERFNGEIKRRTKVIRIFPNRESFLRLVTALCMEQSEEWITGRRYVNGEDLREFIAGKDESKQSTGDELNLKREVVLA
ncbi:MAG: IS256 family transposase [Candidatus Bipolaricaulia bacterium]